MSKLSFETPEFLKLVNDPDFRNKLEKQTTKEGIKELFEKNGAKMTDEQSEKFEKAASFANSKGEVGDSILENVLEKQ